MSAAGEGNIEKAIDMYTKAIQLKPDYAAAHNNLGFIYSSESYSRLKNDNLNLYKAINEVTKAIHIRLFDATYYLNRGITYSKLKDHKKAIDDFSNVIQYGSDKFKRKTLISYQRGQEYMEIKDYRKAIDDFSEAIRLNYHYYKLLCMRGNAYLGAGEKDKAKADFCEYYRKKRGYRIFKKTISKIKKALTEKHFFDSTEEPSKEQIDQLITPVNVNGIKAEGLKNTADSQKG
jgi:tetratricopeptide (TPR) repeat protein